MNASFPCRVRVVEDRLWIARLAESVALAAGLSRREALDVALVASELASNVARHGGGGALSIEVITSPRAGVRVHTSNASRKGTSGRGLGAGLPTIERLVSRLEFRDDGAETRVEAVRYGAVP